MNNENVKDNLIHGLADAFAQEDGPKKEKGVSRFNKATGTLLASNTYINQALSHIDEPDCFTKGKVYTCSQVENDFTKIISDSGKVVQVNINDSDFTFKINPRKTEKHGSIVD